MTPLVGWWGVVCCGLTSGLRMHCSRRGDNTARKPCNWIPQGRLSTVHFGRWILDVDSAAPDENSACAPSLHGIALHLHSFPVVFRLVTYVVCGITLCHGSFSRRVTNRPLISRLSHPDGMMPLMLLCSMALYCVCTASQLYFVRSPM